MKIESRLGQDSSIYSSRFNCCFSMPAPPAEAVTMQAVEGLVKQCVQREVYRLQKSLDELAQDHKKALEDNSSLKRSVGQLRRELAKYCEQDKYFQQTFQRMVERVNPCGRGSDQNGEQQLLAPSQERVSPPCLSASPSSPMACRSSRCAEPQFSPHLPFSPNGAVGTPSTPNILPDIVLQTVDPRAEDNIFRVTKHQDGCRRPDEYAARMFMMIVDFSTYLSWVQTVHWTGSAGKQVLPRNVILKLKELLQHRYKNISKREWKHIRDRVNERLRNPRKLDPRKERVYEKRLAVHLALSLA